MKVFNVFNRELAECLARNGFEIVGEIGDNVNLPKKWTIYGDERNLNDRQKRGITWLNKLQKEVTPEWQKMKQRQHNKRKGFQLL